MSKFEKGAPRESHEFRLAPREVPPSPCGGGVEPRHHVRDRHDNGWGVVPNYISSAAVGPEVEGATNVCVPFCGQPFWSVDPPSWSRLCAPRFLGILPELFRTPVMRDGHQALPRDLEEHHTQSYVKNYVKNTDPRGVLVSDRAERSTSGGRDEALAGVEVQLLIPPLEHCSNVGVSHVLVKMHILSVTDVQRSSPLRFIARKKLIGRRTPSALT